MIDSIATPQASEHPSLFVVALGRNEQQDRVPDDFVRPIAEETFRAGVPADDGTGQILADDRIVGRIHDRRDARSQDRGFLGDRDVAGDLRSADDMSRAVFDRRDGNGYLDIPTILGHTLRLEVINVLTAAQ